MLARQGLVCRAADVALLGIAVNAAVLVATPPLRPDLDVLDDSVSFYAIGPFGFLQAVAFVALGIASLTLALSLARTHRASPWMHVTTWLLGVSGLASLGLAWFPMGSLGPATMLGDAHQTAGTIGGVAQLVAALAFALAIRRDPSWRGLFTAANALVAVAVASAVISQAAIWWPQLGIPMGATMRLLIVPLLLLWGLVAWRLRRTCPRRLSQSAGAR